MKHFFEGLSPCKTNNCDWVIIMCSQQPWYSNDYLTHSFFTLSRNNLCRLLGKVENYWSCILLGLPKENTLGSKAEVFWVPTWSTCHLLFRFQPLILLPISWYGWWERNFVQIRINLLKWIPVVWTNPLIPKESTNWSNVGRNIQIYAEE